MAIGADKSLRGYNPSPLPPPRGPAKPQSGGSSYRQFAINDNAVADMQNNQRAAGVGAGRAALTEMDRGGVSRGRGQQYLSDMAEMSANVAGNAAADKTGQMAAFANANAQRAYDSALADEQVANKGLLEGLRNTSAMERLSRRGLTQNMNEAIRRGQFGLDQMQMDYTPLIANLFR